MTTKTKKWLIDADAAQELADALIDEGWCDELSDTREMLAKWLLGEELPEGY